jgi:hypothetical protein
MVNLLAVFAQTLAPFALKFWQLKNVTPRT